MHIYIYKRNLEIEDYDSKTHAAERAANETVIELLKQKIRDIAKEQILDYKLQSETYDFEPDTFTASGAVDTADFITFKAFKNNGEEEQKTVFHALFGGAEVTWKYKDGMYQVDSVEGEIDTPSANIRIIDSDGRGKLECPYCYDTEHIRCVKETLNYDTNVVTTIYKHYIPFYIENVLFYHIHEFHKITYPNGRYIYQKISDEEIYRSPYY